MNTVINLLSVIPVRREPAHRSELVSQLLFGEYAEVLEEQADFVKVRCLYDDYEGWVQASQLTIVDDVLRTDTYICDWCQEVSVAGKTVRVPLCTPIYQPEEQAILIGNREIRYLGRNETNYWEIVHKKFNKENLQLIYKKFMNTPYLWGGKSVFGIDCSGFAQQVYKMFGIKLLRDAYLQAEQGTAVDTLDESKFGDLAFFQNENGKVTHVGILIEGDKIVHASGNVRIDTVDADGIMNVDTGKRTHRLHSVRRVL